MNIRDSGFFVIRTPLLPFDDALRWGESLGCSDLCRQKADEDTIKRAWSADIAILRERLRHHMETPDAQQALAIASPSLFRALTTWIDDPDSKKGLQAERAMTRYFMRMTGRSTPFGLFSGCSVGTTHLDRPTQITLAPRSQYRTVTRLDFDYLTNLTTALCENRDIRLKLRYTANSTLHRFTDGWHYLECRSLEATRSYHLARLQSDTYLDSVIASTKNKYCTPEQLVAVLASLVDPGDITTSEIEEYINSLIENNVIVPSILPRLTGDGALRGLLADLRDIPSAHDVYTILSKIEVTLSEFDMRPFTVGDDEYRKVAEQLEKLPGPVDPERIVHVDMVKPVENANLGGAVISEVVNALRVLGSFAKARDLSAMITFREAFIERYEKGWVPLTEALDPEIGIGYGNVNSSDGSNLLAGMALGSSDLTEDQLHLDTLQSFLLQKIIDSVGTGKDEVEITPSELPNTDVSEEFLPDSFSVLVSLKTNSAEALSDGNFELIFKGGQGPSSARALARFCLADLELRDLVTNALREEEASDPDAIFAEIVSQPEGRTGNIISRPVLREFEIPFMGRSGAPAERQLFVDDFLVGVSEGRVILYSRSLQREIQPRLSSAHNYAISKLPPIYRFLCDLQNQGGVDVPNFRWGGLSKLRKLPRVRVGRVVIARAQWKLSITELAIANSDRYEEFLRFKELQNGRGFPRWVMVSEFDSMLPLDLDNPLCVDSLLQLLKRSREATLIEMYLNGQNQAVTGAEGAFQHELVIPLSKNSTPKNGKRGMFDKVLSVTADTPRTDRLVAPGGSWYYVKIYSGYSVLDEVLTQEIGPLMSTLCEDGSATNWFVVRYADPHPHLRLRFQAEKSNAFECVTRSAQSLLADGRVWKVQWDTYHREIERYGGPEGMLASEELFCADSDATLTILRALDVDDFESRWKSAMLGVDKLLTDFNLSMLERVHLANRMRGLYAKEFGVKPRDKNEIGARFRRERKVVESLLNKDALSTNPAYAIAMSSYQRRSDRIRSSVDRLITLDKGGRTVMPLIDIIASHLHMNINRIMRSSPRENEFVIYEFLYRVYEGRCAREKIIGLPITNI